MSNVLDALIGRVANTDLALANEIASEVKKLQNRREYGLVYEPHAPEGIRLWGKKILSGDIVHVLPPRGVMEKKDNFLEWKVVSITKGIAHVIRKNEDGEIVEQDVSADDLVAYADFTQTVYPGLLEVDRVERGSKDDPYHVVINGENFHALQAMLWCYAGKVDCIYIDPPYNTGAKDWKYNNDYVDGTDQYRHSKWLSFMEQRLKLAAKLLNPKDSVLIVTIDEKEYLRLGMLLEQMFPEANMQMISTVINPAGSSRDGLFARTNEYIFILCFGRGKAVPLELSDDWKLGSGKGKASQGELRWNGLCRTGTGANRIDRPNMFYPIYVNEEGNKIIEIGDPLPLDMSINMVKRIDGTKIIFPIRSNGDEGRWRVGKETLLDIYRKGYVRLGAFSKNSMAITYLSNGEQRKIENGIFKIIGYRDDGSVIVNQEEKIIPVLLPGTVWTISSHDSTQNGTKFNSSFLSDRKFPFPKSVYAVEDVLRFFLTNKPNALIVDFFAGSGTTAHAVMLLNHLDGGKRKSISVTNNEIGPDTEKEFVTKKHLRPTDVEWQKYGIAKYITWERIKAAMTGINTKGEPIKGDYKFTEEFPMSEGFKENAVFFDLKYEDGKAVRLNMAFREIAPLLWMKAGSKGRIIQDISPNGYDVAEQYGVLFDFIFAKDFIKAVKDSNIKVAYIVTDSEPLYQQIYKQLPKGVEPVRLYENYLTSFAIYGAV